MDPKDIKLDIERLQDEQMELYGEVCDFCGRSPGAWVYLSTPALVMVGPDDPVPIATDPEWTACNECRRLIDTGDRNALTLRGCSGVAQSHMMSGLTPEQRINKWSYGTVRQMHDVFFRGKKPGQPRKNDPESLKPRTR